MFLTLLGTLCIAVTLPCQPTSQNSREHLLDHVLKISPAYLLLSFSHVLAAPLLHESVLSILPQKVNALELQNLGNSNLFLCSP